MSSRLAPLGRKGHTAAVVRLVGEPCVLIFGGAPAGRRGLSNAIYSVSLALLSAGAGTWERHRPSGTAPAPRHGHTLTPVEGGKRLVLFGGVAESGELLGDIQVMRERTVRARRCLTGGLEAVDPKLDASLLAVPLRRGPRGDHQCENQKTHGTDALVSPISDRSLSSRPSKRDEHVLTLGSLLLDVGTPFLFPRFWRRKAERFRGRRSKLPSETSRPPGTGTRRARFRRGRATPQALLGEGVFWCSAGRGGRP